MVELFIQLNGYGKNKTNNTVRQVYHMRKFTGGKSNRSKRKSSAHPQQRPVMGKRTLDVILRGYPFIDRDYLIKNQLIVSPPPKGEYMISSVHRSNKGEELLRQTKRNLSSLLYNNKIPKHHKEIATIIVDQKRATVFDFMKDVTKWTSASDGYGNPKMVIEVEYWDSADERIGKGIIQSVNAINELEINDPDFYIRTEKIEESNTELDEDNSHRR